MFENLDTGADVQASGDSLGNEPIQSGLYRNATIKMAHVTVADSGAMAVNFTLETENKRTLRRTEYITSGTAKGGKNTYERDGKKYFLPGFTLVNDMCLLAAGKPLNQLPVEDKVIPIYNFDAGEEVPTPAKVITSLINTKINFGAIRQIVDKRAKNAENKYVATGETREEVIVDKFFRASDGKTVTEILAKDAVGPEGEFQVQWEEKYTGNTIDRSTKKAGGNTPAAGGAMPGPAGRGIAPSEDDLFAKA